MNAPILPGTEVVEEVAATVEPVLRTYRHAACGKSTLAGNFTPESEAMPCPTCGSLPPQKEFVWGE